MGSRRTLSSPKGRRGGRSEREGHSRGKKRVEVREGRRDDGEAQPARGDGGHPEGICDKYSASMKITSRWDRISHYKTASGTNSSKRWTYRVSIINTHRDEGAQKARREGLCLVFGL